MIAASKKAMSKSGIIYLFHIPFLYLYAFWVIFTENEIRVV